ncbi:unnamed protein product [Discula destructiva]
MQYTSSFGTFLVGLLAVSETATAVPTGPRHSAPITAALSGQVSVKQVRHIGHANNKLGFSRHGALAREKAYLKYGAALPDELSTAVSRVRTSFAAALDVLAEFDALKERDTGSAVTTPEAYDVEYLTPVQIGSPAQTLNLNIDTGSSDLWVYYDGTPETEMNGQAEYTPGASNTSVQKNGLTWSIKYGDGSTSKGTVYSDVVAVGGLRVANQAVQVASEVSTEFTADTNMDGLLGLGFSGLNTVYPSPQKTLFDNALSQLDAPLFTADLKAGEPGTYDFGFINESLYTGNITYTPVDSETGYWKFTASGYQVGEQAFKSTEIIGIADTGTTLLMLPQAIVDAYYAQIASASYDTTNSGYVFDCSITPPDFTLGIEEGRIVIPGEYIIYSPIDSAGRSCYGGIQDDSDIGFSIFGDVALKAAFVVFEGGADPKLGWASKNL